MISKKQQTLEIKNVQKAYDIHAKNDDSLRLLTCFRLFFYDFDDEFAQIAKKRLSKIPVPEQITEKDEKKKYQKNELKNQLKKVVYELLNEQISDNLAILHIDISSIKLVNMQEFVEMISKAISRQSNLLELHLFIGDNKIINIDQISESITKLPKLSKLELNMNYSKIENIDSLSDSLCTIKNNLRYLKLDIHNTQVRQFPDQLVQFLCEFNPHCHLEYDIPLTDDIKNQIQQCKTRKLRLSFLLKNLSKGFSDLKNKNWNQHPKALAYDLLINEEIVFK